MELCPYCGEDVPPESGQCWKCGGDLTAADRPRAPEPGGAPLQEHPSCPWCEAPVEPTATRCGTCGRTFQAIQPGVGGVVAAFVAVACALAGVIAYVLLTRPAPAPEAERPALQVQYDQLERIYRDTADDDPEAARVWAERHAGRVVEWTAPAHIVAIPAPGVLALDLTPDGDPEAPAVLLTLRDPAQSAGLTVSGRATPYTGRLDHRTGRTFHLVDGRLLGQE